MIGQTAERVILWGICDRTGSRNSNIVGIYLIGQTAETVILCVYVIGQTAETVILWGV